MENGGIPHKEDHGPALEGHKQRHYQELVGSLMYTLYTRPDCAFSTSTLGQYNDKSTQTTWKAGLRVLRNLGGTMNQGLEYQFSPGGLKLSAYADADWAGCRETRKSTTGFVVLLNGTAVSYGSKKQRTVATSSTEVEYVTAGTTAKEII